MEKLWMMDLNTEGFPVHVHLIVFDDGVTRVAKCGKRATQYTHPRGWLKTKEDRPPVQDHVIHCGLEEELDSVNAT